MTTITTRSELIFCYDITDANPNGDMLDANKPRIDDETGHNFVTDVRLKRTIRDYLITYEGFNDPKTKDVFVRETPNSKDNKGLSDGKDRTQQFKNDPEKIRSTCIDVRLFGAVCPINESSITFTGPVQFRMGRSLHKVVLKHIQGTGAFASEAGKSQKTFREEHVLHYSFIAFHGIINQITAQHTGMTEDDRDLLLKAMWHGTRNVITRTKFGQQPRLLVKVNYKTPHFFIGNLDKQISLIPDISDEKIRSTQDFTINIAKLLETLEKYKQHISSVEYQITPDLRLEMNVPTNWISLQLE